MMKKKDKKKLKKKDKTQVPGSLESRAGTQHLKQRIKQLERALKQHKSTIEALMRQLKACKAKKIKKRKPGKGVSKSLFAQQKSRVAIDQRKAWKRHGYLRDRYEFHLGSGHNKTTARNLADIDLREEFGEEAGYSAQELEQILS
ncbi:MAG: hypothetical protein ABFS45_13750 [Pseudomonadota bacterium]